MDNLVSVIISSTPERISLYTQHLRALTTDFRFFSSLSSLLADGPPKDLRLLIIDNVFSGSSVVEEIGKAREDGGLASPIILLISEKDGCPVGIRALEAGADDYISLSSVPNELLIRARLHLSRHQKPHRVSPDIVTLLDQVQIASDRLLLQDALMCIDQHIGRIKGVQDVSLHIGQTVGAINKVFKEYLNTTTFRYIRLERIRKAKKLLVETRMPVTEIAAMLGYSTSPNFSTAFKQEVGQSPRDYRTLSLVS